MCTEVPGGKMARCLELTSKIPQRNKQGVMKQTLGILVSVESGGNVGVPHTLCSVCVFEASQHFSNEPCR